MLLPLPPQCGDCKCSALSETRTRPCQGAGEETNFIVDTRRVQPEASGSIQIEPDHEEGGWAAKEEEKREGEEERGQADQERS